MPNNYNIQRLDCSGLKVDGDSLDDAGHRIIGKCDKRWIRMGGGWARFKRLLQKVKPKPLLKLWLALETAQLSARLILIGQLRHSIC